MVWRCYRPMCGVVVLQADVWCGGVTGGCVVWRCYRPMSGVVVLQADVWCGGVTGR